MSFVQDVVTLKRGAVTSQGDHLPPLAAGQPGHFLGELLLSQIGNIPLPKPSQPCQLLAILAT